MNPIKVLFICHGNICRSPMAEFIMKDMVKHRGVEDSFLIASAATSTEEIWNGVGNPVYPPAAEQLRRHGISCTGKRAVQVKRTDYNQYDYLVCMDQRNVQNLMRIVKDDSEHKISLLLDYTERPGRSISDPWYTEDFETAFEEIEEGIRGFLKYLGY